ATGLITSAAGKLSTPRAGLSATTLLDGKVLLAGGSDGSTDLASAEIYDPAASTFSATANLAAPRRDHIAYRLPDNNSVLFLGGMSAGAPLATAELFIPWEGRFKSIESLADARRSTTGTPLKKTGKFLVAGGANRVGALASTAVLSNATVMT